MQIDRNFQLKRFDQVDHGCLLVGTIARKHVVRGMKAFRTLGDGKQLDFFVTLGPFSPDERGFPHVYEPVALRNCPVLDISDYCRLSPSLAVVDLLPELPSTRDSPGIMFLLEDRALLGVKWLNGDSSWLSVLLNLDTGELVDRIEHDRVFATRRWSLVGTDRNGETVTLFDFTTEVKGT